MAAHPRDDELFASPAPPAVEQHVATCARCRVHRRIAGRAVADVPDRGPSLPLPPDADERFTARVRVGVGPRGIVEAAWDRVAGRRVAYKHVPRTTDFDRLEAWRRAVVLVGNPNVAEVYTVDQRSEFAYARELATGRSLQEIDPAMDRRAVLWFGQVAAALVVLHAAGVVHGAVQGSNLWIRTDGSMLLVDGGLDDRAPDHDLRALAAVFRDVEALAPLCARILGPSTPSGAEILATVVAGRDPTREGGPRFRRVSLLGVGAMGEVHRVYDPVLERMVAEKSMAPAVLASGRGIERFLGEARLTAQLQHPGIVPVHEMTQHRDGTVTFTMKEVQGSTLAERIAEVHAGKAPAGWSVDRLVRALRQVCDAIAYAHAQGILHRDLKPSNVMLGEFGEVLVVDWGLARRIGDPGGEELAGTPAYMAPELRAGDAAGVRSDIFALGACLVEILSGAPPGPDSDAARLRDELPRPIRAIARKATERSPDARYASVEALAADLEAWRTGAPVSAYRETSWERIRRVVRPYDGPLAVGVLASVVLAAGWLVSAAQLAAAEETADANLAQMLVERAQLAVGSGDLILARLYAAGAVTVADRPDARGLLARLGRSWEPALQARHRTGDASRCGALGPVAGGLICVSGAGVSRFAVGAAPATLAGGALGLVALEPDTIWLLDRGHLVQRAADTGAVRASVFVAADAVDLGRTGAGWVLGRPHELVALDLSGARVGAAAIPGTVAAVEGCGPARALVATAEGRLFTWDGAGPIVDLQADAVDPIVACEPNGRRFAVASGEEVQVWQVDPPLELDILEGHHGAVGQLAWSIHGALATGAGDATVRLWRVRGTLGEPVSAEIGRVPFHDGLRGLAFDADGESLWTSAADGLRELSLPAVSRAVALDTIVEVASLAWGDAGVVYVVDPKGMAQPFFADSGAPGSPLPRFAAVAPSPTGARVIVVSQKGSVAVLPTGTWAPAGVLPVDATTDPEWRVPNAHAGGGYRAAWGRRFAATGDAQGAVRLWDVNSGPLAGPTGTWSGGSEVQALEFSGDGARLLVIQPHRAVLLDPASTQADPSRTLAVEALSGALDRAGETVALGLAAGGLVIYAGSEPRLVVADGTFVGVAYSPDDAMVAAVTADGLLRVFDAASGAELARLFAHPSGASDVAFSPAGDVIASGGARGGVLLLSTAELRASRAELEATFRDRYGIARVGTSLGDAP